MKHFRRLFCVFLVCVSLLSVFSITASASSNTEYHFVFEHSLVFCSGGSQNYQATGTTHFTPYGDSRGHDLGNIQFKDYDDFIDGKIRVFRGDSGYIFKSNKEYQFSLTNLVLGANYNGGSPTPFRKLDDRYLWARINYNDGTYDMLYVEDGDISYIFDSTTNSASINFNFEPSKDCRTIDIIYRYYPQTRLGLTQNVYGVYLYHNDEIPPVVDIEIVDEDSGFLSNIFNWVKSIFDRLGNIFNSIGNGFSDLGSKLSNLWTKLTEGFGNVVNSIVELPSKLWNLISDGLRSLFVPGTGFFDSYLIDFDILLADRFGAVYEVFDVIIDFVKGIGEKSQTHIYFPKVDLTSVGIPFVFGGWTLQILPDSPLFSTILDICRIMTTCVCVFLFLNALRKRYDEIMGVEQ